MPHSFVNRVWQAPLERASILGVILLAWTLRVLVLDTLPPGLDRDTASNGVYALHVVYDGARPFFISHIGAAQPLIIYLQALSVAVLGANIFALRLVTAVLGTLTIPALYALTRALRFERRLAVLASFGLAISLDHIYLSRLGLRAILVPLCLVLLILFFQRAVERMQARDSVFTGLILGLSLYTYLAASFFPLLLVVFGLHRVAFHRARLRLTGRAMLLFFTAFGIVLVPLALFTLANPDATFSRAGSVSLLQNPAYAQVGLLGVVGIKLLGEAKMFGIEWMGQYNPLSQPLLDPVWFALLLIGMVVALRHFARFEYAWAILTLGVMLLPDILGGNEPYPHELRTIGILPPVFFLGALGLVKVISHIPNRWRAYAYAAAGVLLVGGAAHTYDLFFNQLARQGETTFNPDFNFTHVAEGEWLAHTSEPVLVPLNEFARQSVHFLAAARAPHLQSALDAQSALIANLVPTTARLLLPAFPELPRTEGRIYANDPAAFVLVRDGTAYILPPLEADSAARLQKQAQRAPAQELREPQGQVAARVVTVDNLAKIARFQSPVPGSEPIANFGGAADLAAFQLSGARAQPGETVELTLLWRARRVISDDDAIFIHLLDAQDNVAANYDSIPGLGIYPTWLWKPSEVVATHHPLRIPNRAKPGRYTLEIGLYDVLNGERVDNVDEKGASIDNRLVIGQIKVAPPGSRTFVPSHLQTAQFDDGIALLGHDLQADDNAPHSYHLVLYWKALSPVTRDYTVFVHILDARGNIIAQADHQPQYGNYPTSIWDENEQVRDETELALPDAAPPGTYQIKVGLYDLATNKRLSVRDAVGHPQGDFVILDSAMTVK